MEAAPVLTWATVAEECEYFADWIERKWPEHVCINNEPNQRTRATFLCVLEAARSAAALLNERDSLLESMAELRAAKLNEMAEKMDQSVMKGALEAQALTRTVMAERDSLVAENERLRLANTWERMDEPQTQHLRLCTASYVSGIEHRIIYCGLDEGHDGPHRVPATNGGEDERGNAA
jgi:hypothetical protein